jgi:hypothetical protein
VIRRAALGSTLRCIIGRSSAVEGEGERSFGSILSVARKVGSDRERSLCSVGVSIVPSGWSACGTEEEHGVRFRACGCRWELRRRSCRTRALVHSAFDAGAAAF